VSHGQEEWGAGPYHSNNAEANYSVFKRGMQGVYHCSESICTAIWQSLIADTQTAPSWAWTMIDAGIAL
jgi:hypothetical protein